MLQIAVKRRVMYVADLCCHFLIPLLPPPGEVYPRQVFLHRPGVQERDLRCHPSSRVSSDRGGGGRLWADSGRPHGRPASVLHQARYWSAGDARLLFFYS